MVKIDEKLIEKTFGKNSFVIVGAPEQVTEEECVFKCVFCKGKVHVHPKTVGFARVDFVKKHPEHKHFKTRFVCGNCHLKVMKYMKEEGKMKDLKFEFSPDTLEHFGMTKTQMKELSKKLFESIAG